MTYRNSNHTGRTPRSVQEAFGPYDSFRAEEKRQEKFLIAAGVITMILSFLIILL